MRTVEHFDFSEPDEVRPFGHGRAEILNTSAGVIGRLILEPGWRWSQDVKPIAGTEWCEAPHFQYHVPASSTSRWPTAREFDVGRGGCRRCRPATTHGSSATNRSSWSTSSGRPTTPDSDSGGEPGTA